MGGVLNGEEKSFRHVTMVAKFRNLHETVDNANAVFFKKNC